MVSQPVDKVITYGSYKAAWKVVINLNRIAVEGQLLPWLKHDREGHKIVGNTFRERRTLLEFRFLA